MNIKIPSKEDFDRLEEKVDRILKALEALEPPKEEEYLTRKQVASKLSITIVTVDNLIKKGQLNSHRFGRNIRIKSNDVEFLVDNGYRKYSQNNTL